MPPVSPVDLDAYVDDVKAPIASPDDASSDGSVAGTRVAYDDDFLAVKARIDNLGTLSGRIDQEKALSEEDSLYEEEETTDFEFIASTGHRILVDKSKDLRVACYVALALYHTRGMEGLAVGLAGLRALIDVYWEDLFPPTKRMRGRGASLNFLMQRLTEALDEAPVPTAADRPHLEHAIDQVQTLAPVLMDAMGEHAPVTSKLKRRLEALLKDAPEPEPEVKPIPEPSVEANAESSSPPDGEADREASPSDSASATEDASTSTASSEASPGLETASSESSATDQTPDVRSSTGDGTTSSDALPALDVSGAASTQEVQQTVVRAAGVLRDADRTDPRPYRLLRTMRWGQLQAAPQNEKGRTRIQPPHARRLNYLRGLLDEAPGTLVAQAEDAFQQPPFHFWLDLQRLLAQGMERADEVYAAARRTVLVETALLVDRVPGLLNLTFADGMPFADDATRAWIDTVVRDAIGRGEEGGGPVDAVQQTSDEAKRLLGADGLDAALRMLRSVPTGDASHRTQFRVRLATAQTCLDAGRPDVACPVLDALVDEGARFGLAEWEPALLARVWATLYRCHRRLHADAVPAPSDVERDASEVSEAPEHARRAREAYERVCALDATQALAMPDPDFQYAAS